MTPSRLAICAASTKTTKQSTNIAITASKIASQWNGERKGGDIAHVLFDRLLGLLRLALGAHAEYHFGCDREQQ